MCGVHNFEYAEVFESDAFRQEFVVVYLHGAQVQNN